MLQIVPEKSFQMIGNDLSITLKGFQKWYDKKNCKTAKGKVSD